MGRYTPRIYGKKNTDENHTVVQECSFLCSADPGGRIPYCEIYYTQEHLRREAVKSVKRCEYASHVLLVC